MTGELQGHWEYVIAAYAVTWLFFGGYTFSLWYRTRTLSPQEPHLDSSSSSGSGND